MVGAVGVWLLVGIWALIQISRSCDSFSAHQNQRWRESWVMGWSLCALSRQKLASFIVQTPEPHGWGLMNRRPAWVPVADLGSYLSGPAALVTVAPFSPTVSRELMFPLPTTTQRPGTTAAQVEGSGKGLDPAYSPNSSLIWFSLHWPPFIMMSCYPLSPACLTSDEWEVRFSTGHSLPRSRPCRSPQVRASPHVMGNFTPTGFVRSNPVAEPHLRGREMEA